MTLSTEDKIKQVAREVFIQKGYAATKTRDIAEAANINLALLNYYFRSKENLFKIIMIETLTKFFDIVVEILEDPETTIIEKVESFASAYIDLLLVDPNLPVFVFGEIRLNPQAFIQDIGLQRKERISNSIFFEQYFADPHIRPEVSPINVLLNIACLIVFPFIAEPILTTATPIDKESYHALMLERKKLIPIWIKDMLYNK